LVEDHSWRGRRRVELCLGDGGKSGDRPEDEDDAEEWMDGEGSQSCGIEEVAEGVGVLTLEGIVASRHDEEKVWNRELDDLMSKVGWAFRLTI